MVIIVEVPLGLISSEILIVMKYIKCIHNYDDTVLSLQHLIGTPQNHYQYLVLIRIL